jgi:hypothetical protein
MKHSTISHQLTSSSEKRRNCMRPRLCAILSLAAILSAASCGGAGGGDRQPSMQSPAPGPPADVVLNGNYAIETHSTPSPLTARADLGGFLATSGTTLTGNAHLRGGPCGDVSADLLSVTGTVSGNSVTLNTLVPTSEEGISLTITSSPGGNSFTGTYTTTGTCAAGDFGTVAGYKVPSFTGTFSGEIDPEIAGDPAPMVHAVFTEVDNPSQGTFSVNGEFTFDPNSCFRTGTITSSSGQGALYNLTFTASNGSEFGFSGRESATGNPLQGEIAVLSSDSSGSCYFVVQSVDLTRQ